MKIVYEIGPKRIWIGPTNNQIEFRLGIPQEIPDDLGDQLLKKKSIVFKKVNDKPVSGAEAGKTK
jgi:hypothetical protein